MFPEEEIREIWSLNKKLNDYLFGFDGTRNPYNPLTVIRDILREHELCLPDFELDPAVDSWIYDIHLVDFTKNIPKRNWLAHLEILKDEQTGYNIRVGIFTKEQAEKEEEGDYDTTD